MLKIDFKSGIMGNGAIFVRSRKYSDARVVDIHAHYLYSYQKDQQTHSEDMQILLI